ncbi:undecaprenyl-phosphate galactose phosphotransferase WbaP [Rhodopirellula halodulae]|uniref:undecaprenyl-phosphate galactose phosphotransferase WbaP n=1 Tax=Rhodopirellula halodulae TaxID=2894198 RepID=UPI001E572FD8|nr:undecaprenyl-phosphate galactose phosphotransferase WbaP [Rhodopirellula sp. JC737]MCC9654437.1 undecaprenyl-phosphate galactose phosphotransferase WbaP [Rhodopirellula sp. JC737]
MIVQLGPRLMPQLDTNPLPVGVVCTDTIEQLDPFVPSAAVKDQRLTQRRSASPRKRRAPRNQATGTMQLFMTCMPLVLGDVTSLLLSAMIAALPLFTLEWLGLHSGLLLQAVCLVACYLGTGAILGLFPGTGSSPVLELRQTVLAAAASFAFVMLANMTLATLSTGEFLLCSIGILVAVFLVPIVRLTVRKLCSKTTWWGENTIIVGAGPQGRALFRFYSRVPQRGLRPIGIVDFPRQTADLNSEELNGIPYLGSVQRLDRLRRKLQVRWAIVAPGGCEQIDMNEVMSHAGNVPNLLVLPSQVLLPSLWSNTRECAGVMGVHLKDHLRSPVSRFVKRSVDVVASAGALIALSPLFAIVAVYIKRKSPGPVFYGHKRIGIGGETFKAWKFRTMVTNADQVLEQYLEQDPEMRRQWVEDQKLKNDPRIIPGIGRFLRKTSLDEIPQLWNTLKGEMSLVGPRPIVADEIGRYREMYPLYLRVRPGITGLWQVSGRNDTSYEQRVRLDSYYVCNWSPWLDTYIIFRTIRTMLFREGAY